MRRRVLAVASGGGHWQQMMLMRPAFDGHEVTYVTTMEGLPEQFGATPAHIVPDCNRHEWLSTLRCMVALSSLILRKRPHVVMSTGALPGVIALTLGKLVRARTIWVDSMANAERMSSSGKMARHVADLWLSQWEHVAEETGAGYAGSVI